VAALLSAASSHPVFWTAAQRQLQLFRACTHDGLLYGGPHLHAFGVPACVHHTFTHAKVMADALRWADTPPPAVEVPLPRETAQGVRAYPEVATWLAAAGKWRATVCRNDWPYHANLWHTTGGALALLWHEQTGPLLVSSLAKYLPVESNNMQTPPQAEDFPLTTRVEAEAEGKRCSNLYDLNASVKALERGGGVEFEVETSLCDETGKSCGPRVRLQYEFGSEEVRIAAQRLGEQPGASGTRLVLPVVSAPGEKVTRGGDDTVFIRKPKGVVRIQADGKLSLPLGAKQRVFNLVPGCAAVPVVVGLSREGMANCRIKVV
jgi:hypothetical protein